MGTKKPIASLFLYLLCAFTAHTQVVSTSPLPGTVYYDNVEIPPGVFVSFTGCYFFNPGGTSISVDQGGYLACDGCWFYENAANPNPSTDVLISAFEPGALNIRNCAFEGCRGVLVVLGAPPIIVECNTFWNCWTAVQLDGVQNDGSVSVSYNQAGGDKVTPRDDQFNLYSSSGTPGSPIRMEYNLVQGSPDAPQFSFAGCFVSADLGSSYTWTTHCIALNGQTGGVGLKYANGNTCQVDHCTVYGLGSPAQWSAGIQQFKGPNGYIYNCTSAWWDMYYARRSDYGYTTDSNEIVPRGGGNGSGPTITLAGEKALYWRWRATINSLGKYLGPDGQPREIDYPYSRDFNNVQ